MKWKAGRMAAVSGVLMAAFVVLGVASGIRNLLTQNVSRGLLGLMSVLFLLIPLVFERWRIHFSARFYGVLFAFLIIAYDVGCVCQGFDNIPYYDKVSHFLSGIVFTIVGLCLYRMLTRSRPSPPDDEWLIRCTYAFFFSLSVGVIWEVAEYTGFLLTGHDSQHHLTTGVVDTMQDLISCLFGSLLSAASFILYAKKRVVLLTGSVIEEFDQTCARKE